MTSAFAPQMGGIWSIFPVGLCRQVAHAYSHPLVDFGHSGAARKGQMPSLPTRPVVTPDF